MCVYECVTVAHFEIECRILILLNEILCPTLLYLCPQSASHTLFLPLYMLSSFSLLALSREREESRKKGLRGAKKREIFFSPVLKREDDFQSWSVIAAKTRTRDDNHQGVSHCVAHHGRGVPGRPVVLCCRIVKSKLLQVYFKFKLYFKIRMRPAVVRASKSSRTSPTRPVPRRTSTRSGARASTRTSCSTWSPVSPASSRLLHQRDR